MLTRHPPGGLHTWYSIDDVFLIFLLDPAPAEKKHEIPVVQGVSLVVVLAVLFDRMDLVTLPARNAIHFGL